MSKDPEKSEFEGERVYVPQRRSCVREIVVRAAVVLGLLFCARVVQVYRAQSKSCHIHHHDHPIGFDGPPRYDANRPQPHRWHEKPQPRLSMEEREKLFLCALTCVVFIGR
jgi:hypothetical protein